MMRQFPSTSRAFICLFVLFFHKFKSNERFCCVRNNRVSGLPILLGGGVEGGGGGRRRGEHFPVPLSSPHLHPASFPSSKSLILRLCSQKKIAINYYFFKFLWCFFFSAWVISIGLGMMFLFAPVTSALCERVGCRVVAFVGGLLGILGFVLSSFVSDVHRLYVTFGVLWGIGASMSYLPTLRSLPYWFSR